MNYLKVSFNADTSKQELLLAALGELDYEGFEEKDNSLDAYIPEDKYDAEATGKLSEKYQVSFKTEIIAKRNWNESWESNFEPVFVDDFCTIRASFHNIEVTTPHEIVITPKMSFGTGHHATTQLMIGQMRMIDFKGKKVFDFGTGTGILSILAEQLGAAEILAIDNDEWSYENATENAANNNCSRIELQQGSIEDVEGKVFDIILANINRHILLEYMTAMNRVLNIGGKLIMSGLLTEDREIIKKAADDAGFKFTATDEHNNWIVLSYEKS